MKTVIRIYAYAPDAPYKGITFRDMKAYAVVLVCFILLNVILVCKACKKLDCSPLNYKS